MVIKRKILIDRGAGGAMENRGIVVDWNDRTHEMTIWATTQAPIPLRNSIAGRLGLFENQVRVITPFIGGGFGPKIMTSQADDVLLPIIAMWLNRPIKWIEDRRENFLATTSERDQVHYAEIALTKDGKILGVKDVFYHNTGAYDPYGMTVPLNTQTHTVSNYNVPNFYHRDQDGLHQQDGGHPGARRRAPYGVFVMERLMDAAARELGMDPVEIRRKNLMPSEQVSRTNRHHRTGLCRRCAGQRRLPGNAAQSPGNDRVRQVRQGRTAQTARAGKTSRHRHGVLHRRHRGRAV